MIEIIISVILIGLVVFVFMLDGNISKIPFLNRGGEVKKAKAEGEYKNTVSNNKTKQKQTQDRLPFKYIKSAGGIEGKALILKNDGITYVGVLEIDGVNYNLLSIQEKLLQEEVFQMVLNGLDYPIQIFVQSKKMDIDNYNHLYETRITELKELAKREVDKLNFLSNQENKEEEMADVKRNIGRLNNQIDYGEQVIGFIKGIAYDSDILDKKYYIATSYTFDRKLFSADLSEDEIFVTVFNTINNRLESILSGLGRGGLTGKFLNGTELAELMYSSFNKHDSSNYKLLKAMRSGFSNYIVTSKPIEHKKFEYEENKLIELSKELAN